MPNNYSVFIGCFLGLISLSTSARCSDTVVSATGKTAILGTAYHSDTQAFSGECLKGISEPTGTSSSSFALDQQISESELANDLGFSLGAHARFGVYEGSAEARFNSRSVSSSFSISSIYRAEYLFPYEKLTSDSIEFTKFAKPLYDGKQFERWNQACGDSFVSQIRKGAKLYFSIRIDFRSAAQQQDFSAKFSVSGPMAGIEGTLSTASKSFGKDVKVTISALQIGGDPSKVTDIFGTKDDSVHQFVQCTLGTFEACASVLEGAITYAKDTSKGFPSQLAPGVKPGPVDMEYVLSTYPSQGIFSPEYPGLKLSIENARAQLAKNFERSYRQYLAADRLRDLSTSAARKDSLTKAFEVARGNLALERQASDVCYNKPIECPDTVDKLKLADVDDSLLVAESFRTFCSEALTRNPQDPLRQTVNALINIVDTAGVPIDELDCLIYERLLARKEIIWLEDQGLSDSGPLASLVHVRRLSLSKNRIKDLSALRTLKDLEYLNLDHNQISDIAPLSDLTEMTSLFAADNRIQDLGPIKTLPLLHDLTVPNNLITDITPVASLTRLRFLDIEGNNVQTLQMLKPPSRLGCLSIKRNFVPPSEVDTLKERLPGLVVIQTNGLADARVLIADYSCFADE
ncbi:internalin E (plasmid) [Acidisarcina polymorpha]|uniref:Internalin E n=1 Tax=Acidisarcina polymorpha TaxID=2211140 RepID=A0A2Z5G9L8_9BACT|nr:leucine-rich repeat domain-containing protein [Acidisarcina polymorpha]AXC15943.1 internalin E [Acidisarcina polymorpha]